MSKTIGLALVRDLLEVARDLIANEPDPPRQAPLRRAVSSAYYSVFHAICYVCADALVGETRPWSLFEPIYRSLDHGDVLRRLKDIGDDLGADLRKVAASFGNLQDLRYKADYDPQPFEQSRDEVSRLIEDAARAIDLLEDLEPRERLALAIRLLAKARRSGAGTKR